VIEISVAVIGAGGVIAASWFQNRRTRRMNSAEHGASQAERTAIHQATMQAIGLVSESVAEMRQDLRDHVSDHEAHNGR
jgi:type II secretory pathway pseudopilin PulG